MNELTPPIIDLNNTPDELRANSRLRIMWNVVTLNQIHLSLGYLVSFVGPYSFFTKKMPSKEKEGLTFDVRYT